MARSIRNASRPNVDTEEADLHNNRDSQTHKHTTRSVDRFVDEVHDVEVLDQGK